MSQTITEPETISQAPATPTPAPEYKLSPIEKLEAREKALAEQLKAIQMEIKTKKQRQAAIETNKKRKKHSHDMILLGIFYKVTSGTDEEQLRLDIVTAEKILKDAETMPEETETDKKKKEKIVKDRKDTITILKELKEALKQ